MRGNPVPITGTAPGAGVNYRLSRPDPEEEAVLLTFEPRDDAPPRSPYPTHQLELPL